MGEKTLVIVKPDGVSKGLIGAILKRFEDRGLSIVEAKVMKMSKELASKHYAEHSDKPFFGELVDSIIVGPVFVASVEGEGVVSVVRRMIGETNPAVSAPGTIRGDFALSISSNIIHGSDSVESAKRELDLFFGN